MRRYFAMVMLLLATTACGGPLLKPPVNPEIYRYDIEIGFTNNADEHLPVIGDNLIVAGNGSHKGTPGIYSASGDTIMPFVERGPCAAGSPCWTGVLSVPRDGQHEWLIKATIHLTRAAYRQLAGVDNETLKIYCRALVDGVPVSLANGTGIGYTVTPIQESGDYDAICTGHN